MKIVTVVGARPQFIKAAAVSRAIESFRRHNPGFNLREVIIHTGQHYDHNMSQVFFDELDIPRPDYNLGIGSGTHGWQTGRMLELVEDVLFKEQPDYVLVYGDTNSTLAGALAAAKLHLPVAHVEAGLRSFNRKMPEEINRLLTDHISSLLFCPTPAAVKNLELEGITQGVYRVGDVMFDSILYYKQRLESQISTLQTMGLMPEGFALATVHRAENTDEPQNLKEIFAAFTEIARELPVIVALHPRTRKNLAVYGIGAGAGVRLTEPLSYLQMIELECQARIILTDSGGVQKEAFFAGKPCLTLRNETEWVETVENGANILCGTSREKIIKGYNLVKKQGYRPVIRNFYGNGNTAKEIINHLLKGT